MTDQRLQSLYDEIGEDKINQLVDAFYPKVYDDPVLSPLFKGDINEIKRKQKMFLTQFLGGPALYSEEFGPPAMKHRHLRFEITQKRAESWLRCMGEAFEEVEISELPAGKFFYQRLKQVAAIMVNTEQ
ncbi:globin domain-containing protein [Aquibacillus saliphilus]|uniref:globin domain-containing protein n=1 Tax=Aquibacillus saliphilus TaxID=1909422 RepID=UPI001CF0823C|nr:globin [Aquibacillus saliphilus]